MSLHDADAPTLDRVFDEPWQAQAFALTLALHEAGLFSWRDWAEALGQALHGAQEDGSDYHACWLAALETVLIASDTVTAAEVASVTAAWHRAAEATPHGTPLRIENDPLWNGQESAG